MEAWTAFFTSVAAVLGAIAWPILVGILAFNFRTQLYQLATRLVSLKSGSTSLEFQQALANAKMEEINEKTEPEEKKLVAAKEALESQGSDLSDEERKALTSELISSAKRIAMLEDQKRELENHITSLQIQNIANQSHDLSKYLVERRPEYDPEKTINITEGRKDLLRKFINQVGIQNVANSTDRELDLLFSGEVKAINDNLPDAFTNSGGLAGLLGSGLLTKREELNEIGKLFVRDLAQKMQGATP